MRTRLSSLLLITACLAGIGCASKPAQEPPTSSIERACEDAADNSLHLTSTSLSQAAEHDADIDSILTQQTNDPQLMQINRRMYQSLRSLDVELRREQRVAACKQPSFTSPALQAQAGGGSGATNAAGNVSASAAAAGDAGTSGIAPAVAAVPPSVAMAAAGTAHALRKTSMSASSGGGGNGATAPKIVPGSDNDVVARRLRKAAEQETNPALRAKLWKEYTDYRQGTSAK